MQLVKVKPQDISRIIVPLIKKDTDALGFIPTMGLEFHAACGGVFQLMNRGEAIGFVVAAPGKPNSPRVAHIYMIWVKESERGNGYGRMLVQGIEATLKQKGAESVECYVRQDLKAVTFWQHMGYADMPPRTGGKRRGHQHNHYYKVLL